MFPLLAGLFGVVIGLLTSPNPLLAAICGAFLAFVAWAITGFKIGGTASNESASAQSHLPTQKDHVSATLASISQVAEVATSQTTPIDHDAERKWRRFKIKAFLLVTAVIIAANYERCTETPQERTRKDMLSTQRLQSIASEEAYQDCKDNGSEQECRAAARRAAELAREKARVIYGR
ncbi:hypothetical protein [Methylibium sp.]|uniref:hypothetical protein n=1 Tax=Methylibium sp. TaxID=2067992 RepID=UPI003D11CECE